VTSSEVKLLSPPVLGQFDFTEVAKFESMVVSL
jgi:hypothetical protein